MIRTLLFSIFFSLITFTFASAELVIAYDTQSLGDPKKISENQKIEVDKLTKIAQEKNIQVTFRAIPWKRALLMVEKGLIDGVIQASYKKDRAVYANYPMKDGQPDISKRLNDGHSYYIYRHVNSSLRWDGKKFHNSGTVAAMEKYAVIDDLKKHSNIKIILFNKNSEIIRKLAAKQIDAYAGSSRITDRLLKNFPSFAQNIIRESLPIRKKDYFLIFSKKTYKDKFEEMENIWDGLKKYNGLNK